MTAVRGSAKQPATRRASRADGDATRLHLLETAGQVFAELGFAGATSKVICERAGTPMASINYHFGSREALYEAVLIEAHSHLATLEDLSAFVQGAGTPQAGLERVLTHLVGVATRADTRWGFRVFLREVMSPSAAIPALVEKAIRPKAQLMLGLLGAVLGLPPGHPVVQRAMLLSVLPCIVMMAAPKEVAGKLLPAAMKDRDALAADLVRYALAGLDALAEAHRAEGAARQAAQRAVKRKAQ